MSGSFWGNSSQCFAVCAYVCLRIMLERHKSDYRLTFDFFLPLGATAGTQSHNNGWLFLPGKRWGGWGRGFGRGAGGVYLSHGNWFAGVEVGSFEKTSFSLTPSHLSVWKAAGRKRRGIERGRESRSAAAEAFSYKSWRKWVSMSEGSIWFQPEMKDTFFASCQIALTFFPSIHIWCPMGLLKGKSVTLMWQGRSAAIKSFLNFRLD